MKTIVLAPGKLPEGRDIANTLEALHAAVGGYLEVVSLGEGLVLLVDEEAKVKGGPPPLPNGLATYLCRRFEPGFRSEDYIAGTAVIVGTLDAAGQFDGDFHDLPPAAAGRILDAAAAFLRLN